MKEFADLVDIKSPYYIIYVKEDFIQLYLDFFKIDYVRNLIGFKLNSYWYGYDMFKKDLNVNIFKFGDEDNLQKRLESLGYSGTYNNIISYIESSRFFTPDEQCFLTTKELENYFKSKEREKKLKSILNGID